MTDFTRPLILGTTAALGLWAGTASADIVHANDVIIDGSLCVGFDCVNNMAFGFDTIVLQENNTRIKFNDTSSVNSFPNNDWQLTANESANGGRNKFSVDDITGGRTPFTIEAAARSNALYVESDGDVGFGTNNPAVELHMVRGDTPTMRLEQDGSSGFTPQTWDVAGNETNFFVRDVTNGSRLPFRIRPTAPTSSIFVDTDGDVGMGAGTSPGAALHVKRTDGTAKLLIEEASATTGGRQLLHLKNSGNPQILFDNTNVNQQWELGTGLNMVLKNITGATTPFTLSPTGDLTILGEITTAGSCSGGCDRVFDADYDLPSIAEQREMMFANRHLPNVGPTAEEGPMNLSAKLGGMLNELEKAHIYISQLEEQVRVIPALEARLETLESEIATR